MFRRVLFPQGAQKAFFDLIIDELHAPSLRGILQFGFDVNYSTLKNYYNETRLMPETLFLDLCYIANLDPNLINPEYVAGHWGKSFGGKKSKRKKKGKS